MTVGERERERERDECGIYRAIFKPLLRKSSWTPRFNISHVASTEFELHSMRIGIGTRILISNKYQRDSEILSKADNKKLKSVHGENVIVFQFLI